MEADDYINEEGNIKSDLVEELLMEVISAKRLFEADEELYATRSPTLKEQEVGRIFYTKMFRQCRQMGLPTRDEMVERGVIPQEEKDEIENLTQLIKGHNKRRSMSTDMKYKNDLAKEMDSLQEKVHELMMDHESIFLHTAEAKAGDARTRYFISACTVGGDMLENPVWASYDEYMACMNIELLIQSRSSYITSRYGLPETVLRALARHDGWKILWRSSKESNASPFDGSTSSWSDNQRKIVYWSDFYDSIYKHPECPDQHVIDNDESLQGWLNDQSAKNDKLKKNTPPVRSGRAPTVRKGDGTRHAMTQIGKESRTINAPYKVK